MCGHAEILLFVSELLRPRKALRFTVALFYDCQNLRTNGVNQTDLRGNAYRFSVLTCTSRPRKQPCLWVGPESRSFERKDRLLEKHKTGQRLRHDNVPSVRFKEPRLHFIFFSIVWRAKESKPHLTSERWWSVVAKQEEDVEGAFHQPWQGLITCGSNEL